MARIPQKFIDDLLDRLDIVEVVDRRVKLKKTGKNFSACCPFHDEKTPSFSVNPEKQFYYCFGCGAGGNAIGFVMDYERLDFPEAVESLAQSMGLEVPREDTRPGEAPPADSNKPLHETLERAAQFYEHALRKHPDAHRAVTYLKARGLTGEIAKRYRLGFAPPGWDNLLRAQGPDQAAQQRLMTTGMLVKNDKGRIYDRFRDRVMFPIVDQRGRVIAFGGRVLGDEKPKYLNSPETPVFAKSRELYGLYQVRKSNRSLSRVVVVEGYMDVIALAQHGIPYAVATLGTATSETHLERLFRMTPEVVFCFDGDEAGRKAAFRGLEATLPAMQDGRQARFLFLPEGEDPDTLVRAKGSAHLEHLFDTAPPLEAFLLAHTAEGIDVNSTQGRTRWAKLTLPYLYRLPDGVYRELMLDTLAERTGIQRDSLRKLEPDALPTPQPTGDEDRSPPVASMDEYESTGALAPPPDYDAIPDDVAALSALATPVDSDVAAPGAPTFAPAPAAAALSYTPGNPIHRLIGLLLLRPALVKQLAIAECPSGDASDISLLRDLIEHINSQPDISTAALLGYWYGTPEGEFLAELAGRELLEDEAGLDALASALWDKLHKADPLVSAKQKLQALRQRDYTSMTSEEKRELLALTEQVRRLSGKT